MRQKFRESLKDTMVGPQAPEPEPLKGDSIEPCSVSPHGFSSHIISIWLPM